MKNKLLILGVAFTMILCCCSSSTKPNSTDVDLCTIEWIKGCEVLVCKSKTASLNQGYGYMGMVKVDCDCVFKK